MLANSLPQWVRLAPKLMFLKRKVSVPTTNLLLSARHLSLLLELPALPSVAYHLKWQTSSKPLTPNWKPHSKMLVPILKHLPSQSTRLRSRWSNSVLPMPTLKRHLATSQRLSKTHRRHLTRFPWLPISPSISTLIWLMQRPQLLALKRVISAL